MLLQTPDADLAFPFLEVQAGFGVHVGDQGHRLRKVDVNGLARGQVLIEGIGNLDRAVIHADVAARAFLLDDVSGLFDQGDLEVSRLSFDPVDFGIGQDLDIGIPRAFDELGGLDAHGAVIGGEGLVQLGHLAAERRRFVDQIDPETRIGQIKSGLNAADPTADNQNITGIFCLRNIIGCLSTGVFSTGFFLCQVLSIL